VLHDFTLCSAELIEEDTFTNLTNPKISAREYGLATLVGGKYGEEIFSL
jgi:hypothetical protein